MKANWADGWEAEGPQELLDEVRAWVISRPAPVQDLIRRFPLACLVEANIVVRHPAPGTRGFVAGYTEDGLIKVDCPIDENTIVRADCRPEWLDIVGYRGIFTPECMARILGESA